MSDQTELSHPPRSRRQWHRPRRSLILRLLVIAAIVGALWYVETGHDLPLLSKRNSAANLGQQDATFFSLRVPGNQARSFGRPCAKDRRAGAGLHVARPQW